MRGGQVNKKWSIARRIECASVAFTTIAFGIIIFSAEIIIRKDRMNRHESLAMHAMPILSTQRKV